LAQGRQFVSVDPSKCIGCGLCEFICALEKEKSLDATKARIKVVRLGPLTNTVAVCRFCENAPCVRACPRNALDQDERGIIHVSDEKCDACGWCVEACPYGAVVLDPERMTVLICDLCDGEPRCVEICPTEALSLTTEEEARETLLSSMRTVHEEARKVVVQGAWHLLFARAADMAGKVEEKLKELARRASELRLA